MKGKSTEQKTHQWLPSARVREQSWLQMGTKKASGDGTILYFGWAGGYMTIWICQTQNCILRDKFSKICKLYKLKQ